MNWPRLGFSIGRIGVQSTANASERSKRWFAANPGLATKYRRASVARNPDRARATWREMKRRQREDPKKRFIGALRTQVWSAISGHRKYRSTFDMLGYSREELIAHIERQFLRGMTWGNYGDWHIDHIIPLADFLIDGPQSVRAAWALSNLRPLWASDNVRKRSRRTHLL